MDFGKEGTKWVSTAQPYGKAQATNASFLTDTITGKTELWHVPAVVPGSDGSLSDEELQAIIDQLLESNRAQQEAIRALRGRLPKS